jgi:hypothetical protein
MVGIADIRAVCKGLPRSYEVIVRDRIKFRVGRIVYLAMSRDERTMGIGFPREERATALAAYPGKFLPPSKADERYQWIEVDLAAVDQAELRELIEDAWRMCVPKKIAADYFGE